MGQQHKGTALPLRQQGRQRSNLPCAKFLTCFNIFFILSIIEAIALIAVSFGSNQLRLLGDSARLIEMAEEFLLLDAAVGANAKATTSLDNDSDDLIELEDQLANQTETKLDNVLDDDNLRQAEADQEAANNRTDAAPKKEVLDNYSKRPHIPKNVPVPLFVGGSDGSGTRAFVDVLGHLGVPMLVDDRGTMDIHAQEMFKGGGWPPLVQMILKEVHSANYSFDDLSQNTSSVAMEQIALLDNKLQPRLERLVSLARAGKAALAHGVKFGVKAPVSMLVIPLLLKYYGRIRYIHVVRDGRDVALSANQSPVIKFYRYYYSEAGRVLKSVGNFSENGKTSISLTTQRNLMAMQLWNDWNTEVYDWEQQHADGRTFDFLVMRTEDLLDPSTKFQALMQMADFVGSQKTKREICCMSRKAVVDMGASGGGLPRNSRFANLARNRLTGMSREARMEALKQFRATRTIDIARQKPQVFVRKESEKVVVRGAEKSVVVPNVASTTTTNAQISIPIRRFRARRSNADGIGIPGLELGNVVVDVVKSENEVRKDSRLSSVEAVHRPLDQKRQQRFNELAARVADRAKERIQRQAGVGNDATASPKDPSFKQRHRRRRLQHGSITTTSNGALSGGEKSKTFLPSVEEFRKEYLVWKSEFSKVRSDPARYAEQAYSNGEKLLNKFAQGSNEQVGSAADRKARSDLERQVRAPMAHLSRLIDASRHGRFKNVHERYGKWIKVLEDRPLLTKRMHSEGAMGLNRFGYAPEADFMDFEETDFTCDASVVCNA